MNKQKTTGTPSYLDKANGVRVYVGDLGPGHGFAARAVETATGRKGLFVCVSQDLPAERRGEVVRAMLASLVTA